MTVLIDWLIPTLTATYATASHHAGISMRRFAVSFACALLALVFGLAAVACGIAAMWLAIAPAHGVVAATLAAALLLGLLAAAASVLLVMRRRSPRRPVIREPVVERIGPSALDYPGSLMIAAVIIGALLARRRK